MSWWLSVLLVSLFQIRQPFDRLGMDHAQLAEKGLTIFFTQVFRDNFFHADMHPAMSL